MKGQRSPAAGVASRLDEQLRAARHLQASGRLAEAEDRCLHVLKQHPGHPLALYVLGTLKAQAGDTTAAEDLYRKSLASDGDQVPPLVSLGTLLAFTGRDEEAVAILARATALAPGDARASARLGIILHRLGELGKALEAYRQALAVDPGNSRLLVRIGSCLQALGQTGPAIEMYRKAIDLDPGQPSAFGNLGNALAAEGRFEEAFAAYRNSISLQPENGTAYANLGSCYLLRGDFEHAREAYASCLERSPGDTTALAMQAAVLNELGEKAACAELLDYRNLLMSCRIDQPECYESLTAFNGELEALVLSHPTLEYEPARNTTRMGQQTGALTGKDGAILGELEFIIRRQIDRYVRHYESLGGRSARRAAPRHWRLDMWATVLHEGGHQEPHIHPSGWLSGVYYVSCPFRKENPGHHGWLEFGRPASNYPFRMSAPTKLIEPREGLLVLFPSYFYHRTIPFDGSAPRVSIAFDVVPSAPILGAVETVSASGGEYHLGTLLPWGRRRGPRDRRYPGRSIRAGGAGTDRRRDDSRVSGGQAQDSNRVSGPEP